MWHPLLFRFFRVIDVPALVRCHCVDWEPRRLRLKSQKIRPKARQTLVEVALPLVDSGSELALCQRCSGRIAEKDGDDGKNAAAGSSTKRKQMDGGDPTKVEAAKRRRQD